MAVWSEVTFSEVQSVQRLDSDYWQPSYLQNETILDSLNCVSLGEITEFVRCGPFGSNLLCENYLPSGVLVIRPFNIKNFTLERDNLAYISEEMCSASHLGYYSQGDILFARVGDVRCGILRDISSKATISPNIIVARLKEKSLNPYYVTAFMNSAAGMQQLLRAVKTVAQPTITVDIVKQVRIPYLADDLQTKVSELVKQSFCEMDNSAGLYASAERLLLSELGLDDLDLSPTLFYERTFSESQEAARLDAEFFQPKYYRVIDKLKQTSFDHEGCLIGHLSGRLKYGTSDKLAYVVEGVPFLRIADLENRRFDKSSVLRISREEAREQQQARVSSGDVLISRSGTLGLAVAITEEMDGAIFGSYFIRIRPNKDLVHPEYLALYLNAMSGALQVERLNTGGIQTNLTIPAIESIFVTVHSYFSF